MPSIVRVDRPEPKFPPPGCVDTAGASRVTGIDEKSLRAMRTASDRKLRKQSPPWYVQNGWRVFYVLAELQAFVKSRADRLRAEADAKEAHAKAAIAAVTESAA
jgi:hypothetical protein